MSVLARDFRYVMLRMDTRLLGSVVGVEIHFP